MEIEREVFRKDKVGLAWSFCVSPESCDNPSYYEEYIRLNAIADSASGRAVTHIFVDNLNDRIAGYISLRATSLVSECEDGKYLCHPAIEIAELAVDKDYERNGIGSSMVDFTILLADRLRVEVGIRSIVVVSDPKSVPFYVKQGFTELSTVYEALYDGWNNNCIPMCVDIYDI